MTDDLDEYVAHFQARVLADALASAGRRQLLERAMTFERAKHRPGIDFEGQATTEQLREQWRRCDERARALRNAAYLAGGRELPEMFCPTCHTPTSPWTCSCGETSVREAVA